MSRRLREQAILEVVEEVVVENQSQLVEHLAGRGFAATQATVSRDIKRLGLIKRPARRGGYRYASPASFANATANVSSSERSTKELRHACEQFLTKIDDGDSLLVLRTLTGRANALAVAIDECAIDEVVGTLAGDDTVLLVMRKISDRQKVRELLEELAG